MLVEVRGWAKASTGVSVRSNAVKICSFIEFLNSLHFRHLGRNEVTSWVLLYDAPELASDSKKWGAVLRQSGLPHHDTFAEGLRLKVVCGYGIWPGRGLVVSLWVGLEWLLATWYIPPTSPWVSGTWRVHA